MDAYIFQAALYCRSCGEKIKESLIAKGIADHVNVNDERSYDSDEFPKGPYGDGGGEADSPRHCDTCGVFLENPLTGAGYAYVREQASDRSSHSDVIREWMDFYDISDEDDD